jgi:predicted transglutaminase-like cysteine proteinase
MLLMGTIAANADFVATLPFAQPTHPAGPAKPTAAWTQFCSQVPEECQIDLTEPALIQLTPLNWALLEIINQRINREIQPRTDQEHWGVVDRWDYPEDGYGDCEDYQLLKRKLLIAAGLPRRAMRMTVVLDKNGGGHQPWRLRPRQSYGRGARLDRDRLRVHQARRIGRPGLGWTRRGRNPDRGCQPISAAPLSARPVHR